MKIGIGLPAAVPGRPAEETARWAVESERHGFYSVGVIDRLVYDLLDPMVALAAAAAVTDRLRLTTTALNVGWRNNAVLMAKQLGSLDQISGGRLTAGLGLGAWEDDYKVSGVPFTGRGKALDKILTELRQVWDGEVTSLSGPIPKLPNGGPTLLLGGLVPAAFRRAARFAEGWLAPTFDYDVLNTGVAAVREEWARAGRSGEPMFATARYFCLGPDAEAQRDSYAAAYYGGDEILPVVGPHAVTNDEELTDHLTRVKEAGVSELVLLPCTATFDQIDLLAEALRRVGARRDPVFEY